MNIRCENVDAQICHRYSPGKDDPHCLRCGHGDPCHESPGPIESRARVCWWKRDDGLVIPDKPPLTPPQIASIADWFDERLSKPKRMMRNHRKSSSGETLADHLEDAWCKVIGCYPVPRTFDYPITGAGAWKVDAKATTETVPEIGAAGEAVRKAIFEPHSFADVYAKIATAMSRLMSDNGLEGFALRRIWFRPGEFERMTRDLIHVTAEQRMHMEPAQVGSMFLTDAGSVAVCENPFLPESISATWPEPERRVVCMLEYKRPQLQIPISRWSMPVECDEFRLRFVTE